MYADRSLLLAFCHYENACRMPHPVGGDEYSGFKSDRQDILVLHSIFAEAGKPRQHVKPRPYMDGELYFFFLALSAASAIVHKRWSSAILLLNGATFTDRSVMPRKFLFDISSSLKMRYPSFR